MSDKIKKDEMVVAHCANGGWERYVQGFGRET